MAKPLNVNSEMQPMKSTGMVVLAGLGPCVAAGTAGATVFQIDGFSVTENGQTYWLDDFSDGAAPLARGVQDPASVDQNLYSRAYLTSPLPGPPETHLALRRNPAPRPRGALSRPRQNG